MRHRAYTSLPIMAVNGLVCGELMTWKDLCHSWDITEHHVFMHRLGAGKDLTKLSSADLSANIRKLDEARFKRTESLEGSIEREREVPQL